MRKYRDIIVVSNRSPYDFDRGKVPRRGKGGLVRAMEDIIGDDGVWIGLSRGNDDFAMTDENHCIAFGKLTMRKVFIPERQFIPYYNECANSFIWPLMHLTSRRFDLDKETTFPTPVFSESGFDHYKFVGQTFATAIIDTLLDRPDKNVWIHDYHFMTVAHGVRKFVKHRHLPTKIGQFWHIPWLSPDILREVVPYGTPAWRSFRRLTESLLANDLLGFHIEQYVRNFAGTLEFLGIDASLTEEGRAIRVQSRYGTTLVGAFPIGISTKDVSEKISRPIRENPLCKESDPLVKAAARHAAAGRYVMAGVERLDYTKGIFERLAIVEELLLRGHQVAYVGCAQPSRGDIGAYKRLQKRVRERVARINKRFAEKLGYEPIEIETERGIRQPWNYLLLAIADACLVTTLADGMNLVILEAIIAKEKLPRERRGIIISGECGASALLSTFDDVDGFVRLSDLLNTKESAARIEHAMKERYGVSGELVRYVHEHFDVNNWSATFRTALEQRT